jgi:hypothetical protein
VRYVDYLISGILVLTVAFGTTCAASQPGLTACCLAVSRIRMSACARSVGNKRRRIPPAPARPAT